MIKDKIFLKNPWALYLFVLLKTVFLLKSNIGGVILPIRKRRKTWNNRKNIRALRDRT